jgi:hypothetical protein
MPARTWRLGARYTFIGDPRMDAIGRDPGCVAPTLVSAGGPAPKDPQTLAIRWIGYSNFELAYNGQIFLLDAYCETAAAR